MQSLIRPVARLLDLPSLGQIHLMHLLKAFACLSIPFTLSPFAFGAPTIVTPRNSYLSEQRLDYEVCACTHSDASTLQVHALMHQNGVLSCLIPQTNLFELSYVSSPLS